MDLGGGVQSKVAGRFCDVKAASALLGMEENSWANYWIDI